MRLLVARLLAVIVCTPGCAWVLDFDEFSSATTEGDGGVDAASDGVDAASDAGPDGRADDSGQDAHEPDGGHHTDAGTDCPTATYAAGPMADTGIVCNIPAVSVLDGVGAGLGRIGTGEVPVMDGVGYTACVEADMGMAVEAVEVAMRHVPMACGATCVSCEPRPAEVFGDGRHIATLTTTVEFRRQTLEVAARVIHVCRGGGGYGRADLEVDWLGVPGCE